MFKKELKVKGSTLEYTGSDNVVERINSTQTLHDDVEVLVSIATFIVIIRQPLCPVVGRVVSKLACLVPSSARSCRSSICPGRLSTALLVSLVVVGPLTFKTWDVIVNYFNVNYLKR